MAMGSVGLAGEKIGSKLKGKLHKKGSPDADPAGGPNKPNGPDAPKDGPDAPKGDAEVPKDGAEAHKDNTEAPKDGTETPNNGTETPNAGADASQGGTETPNGGDKKTNDVNSMSEQEIKNEIDKLQPEYNIAKVEFETSEKLRSDFSDFIEGNLSDPAEIKRQYRKLSVLAHPDKNATLGNGVNQGLYQAINNMKAAYDSHDLKKINAARIEFKKVMAIVDVNFSVADVRMKNLHDGLNSAKASGNASGESVHEQSNNSYQDQVHEQASSKFKKTADIRLQANEPMQVSSYDSIRLGNRVDIDLKDFEEKFRAMKDGDSFYIGRTVSGSNDVRINNESVSGTHLKVEKRNGNIYITDMSKNGTTLNTTQPDYAAKYSPETQAKYDNARTGQDYYNIMEDNYSNLRNAEYSYESSVRSNISNADLHNQTNVNINFEGGYCYRSQKGKPTVSSAVDRISLNVVADKNLLKELDELCSSGTYVNSKGERVQVQLQNCTYKTPQLLRDWSTRHDPITMYFDKKVSPEFQDAIAEITSKYQRPSSNGKSLMNSLEGKPWIAHEPYVKPSDAEALYKEAKRLNPDLADAIFHYLHGDNNWNCSTGRLASAQKTLAEYKLASAGKARNVNINSGSITPEHRMAMEQISNNINHARTYKDLENAQRLLNTIPDCRQKEILQRQLNQRFEQAKFKSA